jgi:hypothetical protein
MGHYPRNKKRPSQYRFLRWLYPSAVAVLIIFVLDTVATIPCSLKSLAPDPATCRVEMPNFLMWGLVAVFTFGIAAAGYRFYRDFYLGEYWMDLEG